MQNELISELERPPFGGLFIIVSDGGLNLRNQAGQALANVERSARQPLVGECPVARMKFLLLIRSYLSKRIKGL